MGPAEMLGARGALPDLCWASRSLVPSPLAALRGLVPAGTTRAGFASAESPFLPTKVGSWVDVLLLNQSGLAKIMATCIILN